MKPRLYLYVGHPFDLAYFFRLQAALSLKSRFQVHAVVSKMSYFREFHHLTELVESVAHDASYVECDDIPVYSPNFVRNIPKALRLRRQIRSFAFDSGILLSCDKSAVVANTLIGRFRHVILFQARDTVDRTHYRMNWFRTAVANAHNLVFGGNFVRIMDNPSGEGFISKYELIGHHAHCLLLNGVGADVVRLPPVASTTPKRRVLIFGSRYNQWSFLDGQRDGIKAQIFAIYRKVFEIHCGYEFVYKPHPLEDGSEYRELNQLSGGALLSVGNQLSAEFYLLKNPDIAKCISLGSTSARSAHEMGFASQVFYRALALPAGVADAFDDVFRELPESFFVRTVADLEKASRAEASANLGPVEALLTTIEKHLAGC